MDHTPEAAVLALAARQHGVVDHHQCRRVGFTDRQIESRVRRGLWQRLHRQVYAVTTAPLVPRGRYLAAALGGGPGAVVSHRSAASHWHLQPDHLGPVHVTGGVPRAPRDDLAVHRTRRWSPAMRTVRFGVPVTTLARTIVDLAEVGTTDEVETAIRTGERLHDFDRSLVVPIPGRLGAFRLMPPARYLRGHLERYLSPVLRRYGLPEPAYNAPWQGLEIDAVWWDAAVVLEIDDWETHRHREAFVRDRRRGRRLQIAGFRAIQATYEDLTSDADTFAAELRALGVGGP